VNSWRKVKRRGKIRNEKPKLFTVEFFYERMEKVGCFWNRIVGGKVEKVEKKNEKTFRTMWANKQEGTRPVSAFNLLFVARSHGSEVWQFHLTFDVPCRWNFFRLNITAEEEWIQTAEFGV
jgi:hypothetical protein